MEKISWTDRVSNEAVLLRVKKDKNILHAIKRRMTNWIGDMCRNCLLIGRKHRRRYYVTGRQGRRRKQLLDGSTFAKEYWKLKEKALDRTV
jgi:hypothetical protein